MITPKIKELEDYVAKLIVDVERLKKPRMTVAGPRPSGEWTLITPLALTANTSVPLTNWGTVLKSPVGVSVNTTTGVFSFDHVGFWNLSCSIRVNTSVVKYLWFADSVTGNQRYKTSNASNTFNLAASTPLWIDSGQAIVAYAFSAAAASSVVQETPGDDVPVFRAVYLGT